MAERISVPEIEFSLLVGREDLIPELAKWFCQEWDPYYGEDGPGDADADLKACLNRDTLPIVVVALGPDGALLGTAALKDQSVGSELGVGPWLAALLVATDKRGQGIGTALVSAIEREAARLGFSWIYTSTDSAEGLLRRRGWEPVGDTHSMRGPLKIYRSFVGG
ncbi:MAG: GNAT family N-acetyltransferase [Pseudomonadota bacterium]